MTADTLPVVPLSDISWTNPLVRLILHQIGRRLTEELEAALARRLERVPRRRNSSSGT